VSRGPPVGLLFPATGFDLERKDWTLLNRFRTGHGQCAATLHDWGIRDNPLCACGSKQTMLHILNECPLTKFPGGLQAHHSADEDFCSWLCKLSIRQTHYLSVPPSNNDAYDSNLLQHYTWRATNAAIYLLTYRVFTRQVPSAE